jgi:hypothetical protein
MKIGLAGLDTSHPANWVPILRAHQLEIVAVFDGGSVHPPDYAAKFAKSFGISTVCQNLAEMVPLVEGVILHGCNWDQHLATAKPFLEAGKAVLIDKPFAGSVGDLSALIEWEEKHGARITGGSALRFAGECAEFLARPTEERGVIHTLFGGCAMDHFNYGIHAYAMVCGLMGPGVQAARYLRGGPQDRVELQWDEGRSAFLAIGDIGTQLPFYTTVVTNKLAAHLSVDFSKLYEALLSEILPYFTGQTNSHLPLRSLVEPELAALAALKSQHLGGVLVPLATLTANDPSFDGNEFAREYARMIFRQRGLGS